MRVKREKSFVMPDIEKKKIVVTFVATLGAVLILVAAVLGLVLCKNTMNEKQGLPDIKNCVLDFTGYDTDDKYLKQHMFGTYEFFYNKWIVEESYQGAPDAIVNVPHHYKDTVIDGKRLSSAGYSSYRVIVKGLKVGTPIYFLNNNFVGACYGYVNGELVYKYGTRNKTGNCKSNGEAEYTGVYYVKDTSPLVVVFEVSSSREGGLTSPPRLTLSTKTTSPASPVFTNNFGLIVLGLVIALFALSFIINFGLAHNKRDFSFSLVMLSVMLLTVFSIAVYWRLLAFMRLNTYNSVTDVNFFLDVALCFSLLYHFARKGIVKKVKVTLLVMLAVTTTAIILYYTLAGTFAQIAAPLIVVAELVSFIVPVSYNRPSGNVRSALYGLFVVSSALFVLCTQFDLMNVTIAGLEQSISFVLLPVIASVIIIYRSISVENSLAVINALKTERERDAVLAEALKSQIKPHFVFNCLACIQAAYEKDTALGSRALTLFSKHLRANVDSRELGNVPFSRELENINNYVELENLRREKPITVLLDCMDVEFFLPVLSLQPFIENAFKYSCIDEKPDGYIEIKTYETADNYYVEINDNGVGFDPKNIKPGSVGLKNAAERLRILASATVETKSKPGLGAQIKIAFPKTKNNVFKEAL